MKSIANVTLYELMSEDFDVWITKNKAFGLDISLDNEEGETIALDKGVHKCAIEGFAEFCRKYLYVYDKVSKQEAA